MAEKTDENGIRISVLESQVDTLNTNLDKLSEKVESNYATLHHRISELRDDLHSDIENKKEKILIKLDEHSRSSVLQHQAMSDKLADIEKWRWILVGAAIVLGYFLAHVKLENLF